MNSTALREYRRACVTGGAGFIGSRLASFLMARGLEVTILDNLSVGAAAKVPPGAKLIVGDLLDSDATERAVAECDVVFHLGARVAIRSSFEFVVEDTMTNVSGTASILRAAQRSGSVKRVISTSSMAVYADAADPSPISETHPTCPISPYGISKLASESLTHTMAAAAGLESVVLRLFNTYGAGQRLSPYVGVVTIFANRLLKGEAVTIYGDGLQARDFVHVDDIASAFVCAMYSDVSGETFNIGSGQARTVNAVFDTVRKYLDVDILASHAPAVAGELRFSVADISKAKRLLGYSPKHVFESSIGSVLDEIARPNAAYA